MNSRPIKIPGPDHPIAITPARERITVTVAGRRMRRHARGADPQGGSLSAGVLHPAQGCRHDAAPADFAPNLLPLQGRVRLLQHPAGGEARSTPSGRTKRLTPPYRRSGNTWRSTRTRSRPSRPRSPERVGLDGRFASTPATIRGAALHCAGVSLAMKNSANALIFAGRARAVGVQIQTPFRQAPIRDPGLELLLSGKYWVATNSGSSVMPSPARTVGSNTSTLVPRNAPVGVTVHASPLLWVKRQRSRLLLLVSERHWWSPRSCGC